MSLQNMLNFIGGRHLAGLFTRGPLALTPRRGRLAQHDDYRCNPACAAHQHHRQKPDTKTRTRMKLRTVMIAKRPIELLPVHYVFHRSPLNGAPGGTPHTEGTEHTKPAFDIVVPVS